MKFTTQYISDMISCAESKLAAASTVAWRREYYGLYNLTDSIWHIHQLVLYIFILKRWNNSPGATNASTEEDLSHYFDRIIRMPYPCTLVREIIPVVVYNRPPVVDAGDDQSWNSSVTSSTLAGTVSDPDGNSFTVLWTKISGGNVTINSPGTQITSLTNMQPGTYVFQLTATDSKGASASDDITVTIAQALDTIYWGSSDDPLTVPVLEAFVIAGIIMQANGANDVYVQWLTITPTPKYCWIAIPNKTPSHNKNYYFMDVINQGNMGSPTDLFGAPQAITVNGAPYLVWSTNYLTQFTKTAVLKKV